MLTRDAHDAIGASEPAGAATGGPSSFEPDRAGIGSWRELSFGNLAVILLAFLLPVVWSSSVYNWFTTPKSALALVALGPGLVVLAWLAARRDGAALAAGGFLAAAALATAFAHEPTMSLFGEYFSQNGLLLTAACVSLWALGRTIGARARPWLVLALIAAALVNAAVAWLQMSSDLGIAALAPDQARATGLMGNPVQLAGLCAAAVWLAAAAERRTTRPWFWLVTVFFLIGAVELSGSRVPTGVAVAVVLWHGARHVWDRRPVRAGMLVAAAVLGVVLAISVGGSGGTAQRTGEAGSSGLGTRVDIWTSALGALGDRPLLGYGPGRYVTVSSPRRTLAVARYEGPDVLYSDAHNLVVEYAVSTGLVGIALLGTWLALSGRRSRGALVGFCVVAGLVGLTQPQYVGLTPLITLALGGAMARAPNPKLSDAPRSVGRLAVAIGALLAVVGLVAGTALVVGDTYYARAVSRQSVSELRAAARWLPPWPQLTAFESSLEHGSGRRASDRALALQHETVARDSQDPASWYTLGSLLYSRHDFAAAGAAYRNALARNPWSFFGLAGSYRTALARRDLDAARHWRSRLCRLGASYCPPRSDLERGGASTADGR